MASGSITKIRRKSRRARRWIGVVVAGLLGAMPLGARAAPPVPANLTARDQADVARVVEYLNNIHTMESPFQQIDANGNVTSGKIYVERPGELRLQYDPPVPVMIVADHGIVYYWDSKLQQLTRTRTDDTPAWFLLRPDIKANGDVTITHFQREPGVIQITMVETGNPDLGSVTVTLSDHPLELRQWTVIDAQDRPVTVNLTDPRFGMPIAPVTFEWIDPRTGVGGLPR
jgi:outer membrane lipoprotein-sorting protein